MSDFTLSRRPANYMGGINFIPIVIGDLTISIQASENHYCHPKINSNCSDIYEKFEVALLLNKEWFHPESDSRFKNCDWTKHWSEYDDVAGYVPREDVAQMLEDLKRAFEQQP